MKEIMVGVEIIFITWAVVFAVKLDAISKQLKRIADALEKK